MRKIDETIRQVVGDTIAHELQDPHIGFITVTAVTTSPDLRHADILVTVFGNEEDQTATLDALNRSAGTLQARLGAKLRMKYTPTLRFALDEDAERARRIDEILNSHYPDKNL